MPLTLNIDYIDDWYEEIIAPLFQFISFCLHNYFTERCSVSVNSDFQSLFPTKLSSRLSSWKRSTYEDFSVSNGLFLVTVM